MVIRKSLILGSNNLSLASNSISWLERMLEKLNRKFINQYLIFIVPLLGEYLMAQDIDKCSYIN